MARSKGISRERLFRESLALVSSEGIGGLTLREVAKLFDTSISVMSYHFGQKEDLLRLLVQMAAEREKALIDQWAAHIAEPASLSPNLLATVVEEFISDLVTEWRPTTIFFCELLFNFKVVGDLRPELDAWQARRKAFVAALVARVEPRPAFDLAPVLEGYIVEESLYGLALGEIGAYHRLRRLCVNRLCHGISPDGPRPVDARLFEACVGQMHAAEKLDLLTSRADFSAKRLQVAEAVADLIVREGVDSVTHRSVGAVAGLAGSTVAHHFSRQIDLVRAGLELLVPRPGGSMPASTQLADRPVADMLFRQFPGFPIVRAGMAISLAAMRDVTLVPAAAELRRRRGAFLTPAYVEYADPAPMDGLAAQVVSMAAGGLANQAAAMGASFANDAGYDVITGTLGALRDRAADVSPAR